MLWTIALILISIWLLGLVTGFTMGNFIHVTLAIAILAISAQVEDDCSDFGPERTRVRCSKRRGIISRSGKILPKVAILSGEKVS